MLPRGPSFSGFYNTNIAASWGEITDGTLADVSIKPDKVWRHYWKLLHSIVREKGQSGSVEQRRLFSFIFILRGKKKRVCVRARACVMAPTRALTFQSSDAVVKCSHFPDSRGGGRTHADRPSARRHLMLFTPSARWMWLHRQNRYIPRGKTH